MKVKDFLQYIKDNDISEDAEILIEADYAQSEEFANHLIVSRSPAGSHPDSMIFEFDGYERVYDDDALNAYDRDAAVTSVLISSL